MAFRILIGIILLVSSYIGFETARMLWMNHGLLRADGAYVLTTQNADLTFVSFLDYNCPHCHAAHPVITQAIQADGRIRFIPRPVDVLEGSEYQLSRLPYAAAKQGAFYAMHDALLRESRTIDAQVLQDITLLLGIDQQQLMEDYESEDVIAIAAQNMKIFKRMGLSSIPTYAIGPNILFSTYIRAPTAQDFANIFAEARGQE